MYRYNANNVNWMIEIDEQTVNKLKILYEDPIIYSNYDSVNIHLDNFGYDDLYCRNRIWIWNINSKSGKSKEN